MDVEVIKAKEEVYKLLDQLEIVLGERTELWMSLESAMSNLSYREEYAAYRVGLSDGMQLQQEINSICNVK